MEYLEDEINEIATNSKNKNIRGLWRGINEFKKGYQHGSILLKDGNGIFLQSSTMKDENGVCLQIPTTF
jgi:hypothetical protein